MPFPIALALGAAQSGLGILSGMNSQNEGVYQSAYSTAYQNAMSRYANDRTQRAFDRQVGTVKEQYGYNRDAANRAYTSEQIRLNELFQQAAFQQQGALQNLMEVQGTNNASERYGKSANRANLIGTLGQFGRNQAIQAASLASARGQSGRNLEQISRDQMSADLGAWQNIAVPPMMQSQMPMPKAPSGMNTALMIGNNVLNGFSTWSALKAPSGGGMNFNKTTSFPGAMANNTNLAYSLPQLI